MKYLIVFIVFLSGCATTQDAQYVQQEREHQALEAELKERADLLVQDLKSGKLSEAEFSVKRLDLQERYFPQSRETLALLRDRLALSSALERGDITRLQFDAAWNERKRQFEVTREGDEARYQQQVAQQQNQPMNPVAALIMMNMINNGANRISNSLQPLTPAPVNCYSSPLGGQVVTNCY